MLVSLIYSVYIKVLMGDEKDGFGEFIKNFILLMKRHRTERG